MKKQLDCNKLIKTLEKAVKEHGNIPIYFDTEAKSFDYHMELIKEAYIETEPKKHILLR